MRLPYHGLASSCKRSLVTEHNLVIIQDLRTNIISVMSWMKSECIQQLYGWDQNAYLLLRMDKIKCICNVCIDDLFPILAHDSYSINYYIHMRFTYVEGWKT